MWTHPLKCNELVPSLPTPFSVLLPDCHHPHNSALGPILSTPIPMSRGSKKILSRQPGQHMVSIFSLYKGREPQGHHTERHTFPSAETLSMIANCTTARRRFNVYDTPVLCHSLPDEHYPFSFNLDLVHYTPGEGKEPVFLWQRSHFHHIQSATFPPRKPPVLPPLCSSGPITNHITNLHLFSVSICIVHYGSGSCAPVSPSPAPSVVLSLSDFPALPSSSVETNPFNHLDQPTSDGQVTSGDPVLEGGVPKLDPKALKKAAQKAAAAERAVERQKIQREKAASKTAEKQRANAERERLKKEKEDRERAEKERVGRVAEEKAEREKEKEKRDKAVREQATLVAAEKQKQQGKKAMKPVKHQASVPARAADTDHLSVAGSTNPVEIIPILSKMPKKYKPVIKPIKILKDYRQDDGSAQPSAVSTEAPDHSEARLSVGAETNSTPSRSISPDRAEFSEVTSVEELLAQIDMQAPYMNVSQHPIFDMSKISPAAKMPLEYGPLVHALSALSVGGGSFANSMPSGSIDNAVSSFQQLLETLTQTISDLLRLLPRTTWDDSSSFDGVLRDMLKGDDFLDEGNEEGANKEDEVAALTMALERRARWMEVQLSKLEELHRDINMAAVRAVLSLNDNGWDIHGFMPRTGNTLEKFSNLGTVHEKGGVRVMKVEELEKKLAVSREEAVFAETEMREMMAKLQESRPQGRD